MLAPLMFSCEMGSEMNFDDTYVIDSKIYQYDIGDSATTFITEGFNPIVLPKSNNMLYVIYKEVETTLLIHNFETGKNLNLYNSFLMYNEFSVSPDENYLTFIKRNELKRLNLNSSSLETLFSTTNHLMDYPHPQYSSDGKKIISLYNKTYSGGKYNSDSVYISIYDFDQKKAFLLDTLYLRNNDKLNAGFIEDSEKFYFLREGYHPKSHIWQIELTIYNNTYPSTFYDIIRIYPDSYESKYSVYNQNNLIIYENNEILFYDLTSGEFLHKINFDRKFRSIRNVKNTNYLIGLIEDNIYLLNIDGEILNVIQPNVKDTIVWADFFEKENKIIFRTEEHYYL